MKTNLLQRLFRRIDRLRHPEAHLSFSQEAEDLVFLRTLEISDGRSGFFVDVGAHAPKWISNTFLLYQKGWSGINIDATMGVAEEFRKQRPRDISIEALVGNGGKQEFIDFEGHALSGVTSPLQEARTQAGAKVIRRRQVESIPLTRILDEHLSDGQIIDLLNVDVEGNELLVLQSNNWDRYRPRVLMIELGDAVSLKDVLSSPISEMLHSIGYTPYAKTGLTVFYAENSLLKQTPFGFIVSEPSI